MTVKHFTVTFDERDRIEIARHVAMRREPKRRYGIRSLKVDDRRSDDELDTAAVKAELAVAKLLGLQVESLDTVGGRGRRWAFATCGKTIAVRYSYTPTGKLMLRPGERFDFDLAFLVVPGAQGSAKIVGWIDRETFDERKRQHDFGRGQGPQWVVEQGDLRRIEEVFDFLLGE